MADEEFNYDSFFKKLGKEIKEEIDASTGKILLKNEEGKIIGWKDPLTGKIEYETKLKERGKLNIAYNWKARKQLEWDEQRKRRLFAQKLAKETIKLADRDYTIMCDTISIGPGTAISAIVKDADTLNEIKENFEVLNVSLNGFAVVDLLDGRFEEFEEFAQAHKLKLFEFPLGAYYLNSMSGANNAIPVGNHKYCIFSTNKLEDRLIYDKMLEENVIKPNNKNKIDLLVAACDYAGYDEIGIEESINSVDLDANNIVKTLILEDIKELARKEDKELYKEINKILHQQPNMDVYALTHQLSKQNSEKLLKIADANGLGVVFIDRFKPITDDYIRFHLNDDRRKEHQQKIIDFWDNLDQAVRDTCITKVSDSILKVISKYQQKSGAIEEIISDPIIRQNLTNILNKSKDNIKTYENEIEKYKQKASPIRAELLKLDGHRNRIEYLVQQEYNRNPEYIECKGKINKIDSEIDEAEKELKRVTKELELCKKELPETKDEEREQERKINHFDAEKKDFKDKIKEFETKNKKYESYLKEIAEKFKLNSKELWDINSEASKLRNKLVKVERGLADYLNDKVYEEINVFSVEAILNNNIVSMYPIKDKNVYALKEDILKGNEKVISEFVLAASRPLTLADLINESGQSVQSSVIKNIKDIGEIANYLLSKKGDPKFANRIKQIAGDLLLPSTLADKIEFKSGLSNIIRNVIDNIEVLENELKFSQDPYKLDYKAEIKEEIIPKLLRISNLARQSGNRILINQKLIENVIKAIGRQNYLDILPLPLPPIEAKATEEDENIPKYYTLIKKGKNYSESNGFKLVCPLGLANKWYTEKINFTPHGFTLSKYYFSGAGQSDKLLTGSEEIHKLMLDGIENRISFRSSDPGIYNSLRVSSEQADDILTKIETYALNSINKEEKVRFLTKKELEEILKHYESKEALCRVARRFLPPKDVEELDKNSNWFFGECSDQEKSKYLGKVYEITKSFLTEKILNYFGENELSEDMRVRLIASTSDKNKPELEGTIEYGKREGMVYIRYKSEVPYSIKEFYDTFKDFISKYKFEHNVPLKIQLPKEKAPEEQNK